MLMRTRTQRFCLLGALGLALLLAGPAFAEKKSAKPKHELQNKKFLEEYKNALQKYQTGSIDGAIGAAQMALRTWPKSPRLLALLGWCYKTKKLHSKAIDYFQRASNLFNGKSEFFEKGQALYNVAFCYELMQQRPAAIAAWKVFIAFASNYPQEARSLAFARARVQALTSVKSK